MIKRDKEILKYENHLAYCDTCGQSVTMSRENWLKTSQDDVDESMRCCRYPYYYWFLTHDNSDKDLLEIMERNNAAP